MGRVLALNQWAKDLASFGFSFSTFFSIQLKATAVLAIATQLRALIQIQTGRWIGLFLWDLISLELVQATLASLKVSLHTVQMVS